MWKKKRNWCKRLLRPYYPQATTMTQTSMKHCCYSDPSGSAPSAPLPQARPTPQGWPHQAATIGIACSRPRPGRHYVASQCRPGHPFFHVQGPQTHSVIEPATPVDGNRWDLAVNNMAHDGIKRYYDFTIVEPTKVAFSRKHNPYPDGSLEPLHEEAVKDKLKRYNDDLRKLRAFPCTSFAAMPFTLFGGMSDPAIRVLDIVQSQAKKFRSSNSSLATDSTYTAYFSAACSFAINAYTCYSISHTIAEAVSFQNKLLGSLVPAVNPAPSLLPVPTSSPAQPQAPRPSYKRAAGTAPRAGPDTLDTRISSPFRFQ